jgi:ElaB/YqjD/DUF883 family membrane-anchored ribosome-binding protein
MLKRIKRGTTVIVGSIKHEKNAAMCLNPEFENAKARFKELKTRIRAFVDDSEKLLSALPRVFKAVGELSALTEKCFETLPEEDRVVPQEFGSLTRKMQVFVNQRTGTQGIDEVVRPLKDLLSNLEDLGNVVKEQSDSFLILEQNKSKLESLQKEREKNAEQIRIYTEKIRTRTQEVERLEDEFIETMHAEWENRSNVLSGPH